MMKEHEIRPQDLLDRYVSLSARDAAQCFGGIAHAKIPCVACGSGDAAPAFEKIGFPYSTCAECGTVFLSPRPPLEAFEAFYRESESSRYWAEVFFPAVAEARREKIFRPRAQRLEAMCTQEGVRVERLIDVGAGFGIFLEEWLRIAPLAKAIAIEPSNVLAAECRSKGLEVVEDVLEHVQGLDGTADLVTSFEVLEHAYDPLDFVTTMAGLARPGGLVFVTTLCVDGFDLQVLRERSTQISPPHHINFLSVRGFTRLFERAGLTGVQVTTPGQLDVDIVRNAVGRDPALLDGQRFLQHLLSDDDRSNAFQRFLVEQRLSSHAWILGRTRPEATA